MSLRLQAEAGDPNAQVRMAHASLLGFDVPHEPAYALRLLDSACERDWFDALLLRGALAIMGLATPRNLEEAFSLLSRAAPQHPYAKAQLDVLADAQRRFNLDAWSAKPAVTQRFDAPRIFTFKKFIPKAACDWLIADSRPRLQPTKVYTESGPTIDPDRTGSGALRDNLGLDLVMQLINLRIAGATGTPLLNQEPGNVLHYASGEQNKPHFDFISGDNVRIFADELNLIGQRIGTFLIYLNDGYEGGQTEFPRLSWRFRGEAGDAMFFWNITADGGPEVLSRHAGAMVTQGEKWLLSKWIRSKSVPLWWPAPKAAER